MITQQAGGLSFCLQQPFDFSFLCCYGQPFQVFDQQDSGCMGFGLEHRGRRYFLKLAGAMPCRSKIPPQQAIARLEQAAELYRNLAHPNLIPLLDARPVPQGFALLFPWVEGLCMGKQYPTREAFLSLPLPVREKIFEEILDFHNLVGMLGYLAVDFYDGSILYDPKKGQTLICDIDEYQQEPYRNPVGRMPGSTRFMAPEEFLTGEHIDQRTNVYRMGATAFALFGKNGSRQHRDWPLSPNRFQVARQATLEEPDLRQPSLSEFLRQWQQG